MSASRQARDVRGDPAPTSNGAVSGGALQMKQMLRGSPLATQMRMLEPVQRRDEGAARDTKARSAAPDPAVQRASRGVEARPPRAIQRSAAPGAAPATGVPEGLDVMMNKTAFGPFELKIVANSDGFSGTVKAERPWEQKVTIDGVRVGGKISAAVEGTVQVDSKTISGSGVVKLGGEVSLGLGLPGVSVSAAVEVAAQLPIPITGSTDKGCETVWPIDVAIIATPKLIAELEFLSKEQQAAAAQSLPGGWDFQSGKGLEYKPAGDFELFIVRIGSSGVMLMPGKDMQRVRTAVEALKTWAGVTENKPLVTNSMVPGAMLINAGLSAIYAYSYGEEDVPPPAEKKEEAYVPGQCPADFR